MRCKTSRKRRKRKNDKQGGETLSKGRKNKTLSSAANSRRFIYPHKFAQKREFCTTHLCVVAEKLSKSIYKTRQTESQATNERDAQAKRKFIVT